MTTTFELASSIDTYVAFGVSRVIDPDSVYNSLSRGKTTRSPSVTEVAPPQLDSANISLTGSLVAAALSDSGLRAERLATLRHSIANGTYYVSSAAVAESLLKSTLSGL